MTDSPFELALLTTGEVQTLVACPPSVVLLPVGSVEPHGPHLPLSTDTIISHEASRRAVALLRDKGVATVIAPPVAYGVTEYAQGFAGAIGVRASVLTSLLSDIVERFLADGWSHVCLVNNHLEPAHDTAVRKAIVGLSMGRASVACPLTRRWARTLSDEFKRGSCHAGRYETSLALAANAAINAEYERLPPIDTSLSDEIKMGKSTFLAMGLSRAYTGAPGEATAAEGEFLYGKLALMIATEVTEGLAMGKSE